MTDLNQAPAPGTGSVPAAGSAPPPAAGPTAVFQLLTAALAALNGPGSDPTAVALLSAALAALALPSGGVSVAAVTPVAAPPSPMDTTPTAAAPAVVPVGLAAPPLMLCTTGPWLVEGLYLVVPTGPLTAVVDDGAEHLWYCITKGRYVGVTTVNALAIAAVSGVSSGSMISHKTQALAMASFNTLLALGLVEIR
ncbi:hypothetical protein C8J57DRAFT_1524984 [Mycena rebaudengoi]|nr:hypothetical protein C8J57DRAFT_1524984 [Mycena rebaudengoi]